MNWLEESLNTNRENMRVLISAYACEPGKGSEPGIGWNLARGLASDHDIWVMTRANNREAIEKEMRFRPTRRLSFVFLDLPRWMRWWKRGARGIRAYYYLWGFWSFFVARRLHRRLDFDLIHHVTFGNYSMPSFLPLLGAPFIWGPVGGGEAAPISFWRGLGLQGNIYELLRALRRAFAQIDPFVRYTARRSSVAIATTPDTSACLRRLGAKDVRQLIAVGLGSELERSSRRSPGDPHAVRFLSAGRLLHWKGFHLAIKSFHRAAIPKAELWIVGDGPQRSRLERLARRLSLGAAVRFLGEVPRESVLDCMIDSDVLVHPSLHDSGGSVCLEAMAAEKPVICLDVGGPGVIVTPEVGIKIPATNPKDVIQQMAEAMRTLALDSDLRHRLGRSARRRVECEYLWDAKSKVVSDLYREVLAKAAAETRS